MNAKSADATSSKARTKRIYAIAIAALALVIAFGAAGCKSTSSSSSSSSNESSSQSSSAQQASKEDAKYAVSIDKMKVGKDYQGRPAATVTYTWTNNSDKATSFMVACSAKCFQNGVQLQNAIGAGDDSSKLMNEIKPGATLTVQESYLLDDKSDITVEVEELISFSNELLAEATFSVK